MTTSSYSDLLAQKAALERQAAELQRQLTDALKQERSGVISQIKALMVEHGLTPEDLVGGKASKVSSKGKANRAAVAPKYRDSATGNTWSGRGLKPKWLTAALAAGKVIEDFKI